MKVGRSSSWFPTPLVFQQCQMSCLEWNPSCCHPAMAHRGSHVHPPVPSWLLGAHLHSAQLNFFPKKGKIPPLPHQTTYILGGLKLSFCWDDPSLWFFTWKSWKTGIFVLQVLFLCSMWILCQKKALITQNEQENGNKVTLEVIWRQVRGGNGSLLGKLKLAGMGKGIPQSGEEMSSAPSILWFLSAGRGGEMGITWLLPALSCCCPMEMGSHLHWGQTPLLVNPNDRFPNSCRERHAKQNSEI